MQAAAQRQAMTAVRKHDLQYVEWPGGHHTPQSSSGACQGAREVVLGQEQPHACKQAEPLPPHTQKWAVLLCPSPQPGSVEVQACRRGAMPRLTLTSEALTVEQLT